MTIDFDGEAICPEDATRERIPADFARAHQIRDGILSLVEEAGYDPTSAFAIRIALDEAISNAIRYGCCRDSAKHIRFCYKVESDMVVLEIDDGGSGFALDAIPDPTMDERLECPSGRGIFLMRSFMTKVRFNKCGNCVTMLYKKP